MKTALLICLSLVATACMRYPEVKPMLSEKEYYKQMYEQAAAATQNANTLTQWTLSSVIGIIVLVIGGQLFFNFQLRKAQLESIKSQLNSSLLQELGKQVASAERRISTRLGVTDESTILFMAQREKAWQLVRDGKYEGALQMALELATSEFNSTHVDLSTAHMIETILTKIPKIPAAKVDLLNELLGYVQRQATGSSGDTATWVSQGWKKAMEDKSA